MNLFLKAKHWQLFIVFIGAIIAPQPAFLNQGLGYYTEMLTRLIISLVFVGWLWSISQACYKTLPAELASSPRIMQAGLIYALLYFMIGSNFFMQPGEEVPIYIIAFHLLGMASIFYAFGFTAKQLVKLEHGKDVSFFAYSGPFFLIWFFPLGIWFVQPKVNQLLGNAKIA